MVSHGDRQQGGIVVSAIRIVAGTKDEEQVRRVRVDLRVYDTHMCRIIYGFNKYEV